MPAEGYLGIACLFPWSLFVFLLFGDQGNRHAMERRIRPPVARPLATGDTNDQPTTQPKGTRTPDEREDSVLVPVGCVMVGYVSRLVVSHGRPTN